MGQNSNRSESRQEKLSRLGKTATSNNKQSSSWQTNEGAKIRGILGVEKGNQFINDMSKYNK